MTTVQLTILDIYHDRITSSLDAYETLSSAFVRAVPGALSVTFGGGEEGGFNIDARKLTGGVDGVQRLCKAFLSAVFLETALEGWSEELVAVSSSFPPSLGSLLLFQSSSLTYGPK